MLWRSIGESPTVAEVRNAKCASTFFLLVCVGHFWSCLMVSWLIRQCKGNVLIFFYFQPVTEQRKTVNRHSWTLTKSMGECHGITTMRMAQVDWEKYEKLENVNSSAATLAREILHCEIYGVFSHRHCVLRNLVDIHTVDLCIAVCGKFANADNWIFGDWRISVNRFLALRNRLCIFRNSECR